MLETLISSRTRIKLLLRFFLNPGTTAYLRGLADEFDESTNAIRVELNRFEEAGMLLSESKGNKKYYMANKDHPLLKDLNSILLKHIGVDRVVDVMIPKIDRLEKMYITGEYARGIDTGIIDLIFIGSIDKEYLGNIIAKAEKAVGKKLRFLTYEVGEWNHLMPMKDMAENYLLLWENKPIAQVVGE